jgi:hypothetical protein
MNSATLPLVIAQFPRNTRDAVMIRIDIFNGRPVIDIRTWWTSNDGELKPGRSGITMSVRHLPSLALALMKAQAAAVEMGLLPVPDSA